MFSVHSKQNCCNCEHCMHRSNSAKSLVKPEHLRIPENGCLYPVKHDEAPDLKRSDAFLHAHCRVGFRPHLPPSGTSRYHPS